jgi:hypothetical protein
MDNEDYKVASKGKLKSYEVEYESLSQPAVERLMQRDVDHICGILFVNVRVLGPVFLVCSNTCRRKIDEHRQFTTST